MKPRKVTRRVIVTAHDELRDRLTVAVTVDDSPDHVAPADGDTSANPPVRQRVRKSRRGGTKQRKAPP